MDDDFRAALPPMPSRDELENLGVGPADPVDQAVKLASSVSPRPQTRYSTPDQSVAGWRDTAAGRAVIPAVEDAIGAGKKVFGWDYQSAPGTKERADEMAQAYLGLGMAPLNIPYQAVAGMAADVMPDIMMTPGKIGSEQTRQNIKERTAQDIGTAGMFVAPELTGGVRTAKLTHPIGGMRNAMEVEGDLAKARMADRAAATAPTEGVQLASGVDPTKLPGALANAADTAISKAADIVKPKVVRGTDIPPSAPPPPPEAVEAAHADTRMGAGNVKERLPIIVPEERRVTGGMYKAGRPEGGNWSDLTETQLSQRGPGFHGTDADLEAIWNKAVADSSEAAKAAVARTGATWSAMKSDEWNKAMSLPLRNQLWYELSGEKFLDKLPNLSNNEHMMFLDLIGATSAREKPRGNLERSLAVLSQKLRGVPIDVDITTPAAVEAALQREGTNLSSDLANKTGNFSDTLALTGGLPVRYPISVNDVWEAKSYGITDKQLMSNQALHEVMANYMNGLRDFVNETTPEVKRGIGDNGGPQIEGVNYPHQTWQLQARKWVQRRAADEGIDTTADNNITGNDYAAEWDNVVQDLNNAGFNIKNGVITREDLMDPRFADVLRGTAPAYREAPKATVEFGTLLTPNGQKAKELFDKAVEVGDKNTQREYLSLFTSEMAKTARGKPTIWQDLIRAATDRSDQVTRIYSPTADNPYAISGTFNGVASPNIRIPLKEMDPDQIAYFNAMAGLGLKQKAMAAAEIRALDPVVGLPPEHVHTFSVNFAHSGPVDPEMLTDFTQALGNGYEISAMSWPNGIVFDINPRFDEHGNPEVPSIEIVNNAVEAVGQKYGMKNAIVFDSSYKSEYGKNYVEDPGNGSGYKKIINSTVNSWKKEAAKKIVDMSKGSIDLKTAQKFLSERPPVEVKPVTSAEAMPEAATTEQRIQKDVGKEILQNFVQERREQGQSVVPLSAYFGRASTVRKGLWERLDNHAALLDAWSEVGNQIDQRVGAAIPKWERRLAAREKKAAKQKPIAKAYGGALMSDAPYRHAMEKSNMRPSKIDAAMALARHHFATGGYSDNGFRDSTSVRDTSSRTSGDPGSHAPVASTRTTQTTSTMAPSSSSSWLPSAAPLTPEQLKGAPLTFKPMEYGIYAQPVDYGSFSNDMGTRLGIATEQQYGTPPQTSQMPAMAPWWAPIQNLQSPAYQPANLWAAALTPPMQSTFNYPAQGYNVNPQARQYSSGGYADGGNNSISNALRLIKGQP
jgi:hypothetical protein